MKKLLIALSLMGLCATQVNAAVQHTFEPAPIVSSAPISYNAASPFTNYSATPDNQYGTTGTMISNSQTVRLVQNIESLSARSQRSEDQLSSYTETLSQSALTPVSSFGTSANSLMSSNTIVERLDRNSPPAVAAARAARAARSRTAGLCAKYVRIALQAAGYNIVPNESAYQYATRGTLANAGFTKISNSTQPQVGDVVVFNRSAKHRHGHIQIFDGKRWVSDFKQQNKSPYSASYSYTTWRDKRYHNNASNEGVYLAMGD